MPTADELYEKWALEPSKENMSALIGELNPVISSEASRYSGPSGLMKNRAKALAVKAVKTYDPASKAKLSSWVVTQLQPLMRYGKRLTRPTQVSELAYNQFAELQAKKQELEGKYGEIPDHDQLADATGLSVDRIRKVEAMMPAHVYQTSAESPAAGDEGLNMPAVKNPGSDPALNTAVKTVYYSLDPRDKMIFDLKTGKKGKALENKAIARQLGVSEGLVSQRSMMISDMIREAL